MSIQSNENQEENLELQKDILRGRESSLAELIGREGGGFLKGESPVPKMVQLKTEIKLFISSNLQDVSGALQAVLHNWVDSADDKISSCQDNPLSALSLIVHEIIDNNNLLYEFVRQVDIKWGIMNQERPHFQKPGEEPHPDDKYTHQSVRQQLINLLKIINN